MISSCVCDDLDVGKSLLERGQLVLLAAPGRDQYAAATLYGADHAIDVVVAHAADGELDGVLRRLFGLRRSHCISITRPCSPLKAITPLGSPAIIAIDPINPVCFRKSRRPLDFMFACPPRCFPPADSLSRIFMPGGNFSLAGAGRGYDHGKRRKRITRRR